MKPILFIDYYKTLNHERYWRSLPPELERGVQRLLFGEDRAIVRDWMIGKYTAREVNKLISEKLNIPFDYLWDIFVKDCQSMTVPKETLEKISKLKNKFTTILITGNMDSFLEFTAPVLKLENYFDYISSSFNEKKQKSDQNGAIFIEYAQRFNAPIEKSFLLDDSGSTCKIFNSLGGTAYQVTKEKDVEYYLRLLSQV